MVLSAPENTPYEGGMTLYNSFSVCLQYYNSVCVIVCTTGKLPVAVVLYNNNY